MTARPLWTSHEAQDATGGALVGPDWNASGVSIDSRSVADGDLFVALRGPNFDGHAYVADALAKGAVAALIDTLPDFPANNPALLKVDETLTGLRALGIARREAVGATVIGLTGSVGKTTTKEMLAAAFAALGATHASPGSLNNHWGVPLSLARMPHDVRYGVFEMGMNHAGEIADLTGMVRPHVALITTVAAAHIEFFGTVEAIADAKAEIFQGVEPGGTAILPLDNPHYARLAAAARAAGVTRHITFGETAGADFLLKGVETGAEGLTVSAIAAGLPISFHLNFFGKHQAINALGALAAVHAAGADIARAAAALEGLQPLKGRGGRRKITLASGGELTLIDESYNASPAAVAAALGVLGAETPGPGGRRIAIIGDMLELGEHSAALHAGLAGPAAANKIDIVHCCGPYASYLWELLPAAMRGLRAPDSTVLARSLTRELRAGDVVMVKGSLGSRMAKVVEVITSLASDGAA
jgi:UDP-N-acetylmuramoyl-tripeptide--D-alanyl-D-alanine ligase